MFDSGSTVRAHFGPYNLFEKLGKNVEVVVLTRDEVEPRIFQQSNF